MSKNTNQAKALVKTDVMQSAILPNELRIGNILNFWNNILIVSEIKGDKITAKNKTFRLVCENYLEFSGIKITKQWYYKLEKQLIELGFEYSYSETTNRIFIYIGNFTYQCSFIHQFQNLYFDLTTVELAVA